MTPDRFDAIADAAFESLPAWAHAGLENIIVCAEARNADEPEALGLYEGLDHTERASYGLASDGLLAMPDVITIYRDAILEICETDEDVTEEVRLTIVHEVAHHFGIYPRTLLAVGPRGSCRHCRRTSARTRCSRCDLECTSELLLPA